MSRWIFFVASIVLSLGLRAAETKTPGTNGWSLQPLQHATIPRSPTRCNTTIDAFILAKLAEKGMHASPEADPRTLIRRLYFDLLGLPPTPLEIEAFVGNRDPLAYEALVDRLLQSPHYGERWARHWLDIVHFGETHGYDKDQPRPNAWPYRDYIIRAFNEDKSYTRFVEEQVAGDVLFPDTRDGFEALGFIAAGPWDLIGHAEVSESKMDGQVARHLDRDDMVVNTLQTFNSLTVQCAQCHNHKFDPILQEDYYSLQAVFAAVDRADQKYDLEPRIARERKGIVSQQRSLTTRRKKLDDAIRIRAGQSLIDLDQAISEAEKASKKSDAMGYHSQIEKKPDTLKWVQIDLGHQMTLSNIVLHPCQDHFNNIGDGFGFPIRFKVELADEPEFNTPTMIGDFTKIDFPNPKLTPQNFPADSHETRFIRVTATQLAPRQDDYIFAIAELEALNTEGRNVALGASVSALDSIEAPVRWQKTNLTDGWYPGISRTSSPEIATLRRQHSSLLAQATREDERLELADLDRGLIGLKEKLEKLPAQSIAYVASIHSGTGNFVGTGAQGGRPRSIHVLNRGNLQMPGKETGPGTLSCLPGLPSRFELPTDHQEGDRRAALAKWLTDPLNPLTWRSIVNRVWQYHFGRGLVETPNDFGHMGAQPSHPELLDWLAAEFRDGGQSMKKLHRLIVTSVTYRQSSQNVSAFAQDDSDNRYLWRMNRRKLEAEAVRDAVLFISGKLDLKMGGPSFKDFVVEKPEHSPHYEYQLHDPDDPKSHRRTIYRFIVRSQPQPFLTTLDCADPSMQVAKRNESVSPLQALALLNNPLILTMSRHFAARIEQSSADLRVQVRRAYTEAIGRPPSAETEQALVNYTKEFGLTNYCRMLFNLNEFSFID